jgi:DNA-binding SARP family transcriptional activator/tetratricopeptide (TPR) repeat protein
VSEQWSRSEHATDVRFTVLGPVRAWRGGTEVDLGPPLRRALLAVLLVNGGRPVGNGEIVDVLWGQEPPLTAVNQIHSHVGVLRRLMEPDLPRRAPGRWLIRSSGGYLLDVDSENLDLLRYRLWWQQARQAAADRRPEQAVQLAVQALELWQGPAADGIGRQARSHPALTALDREYATVTREAADLALLAGMPGSVLPIVEQAAVRAPFDEPLQARLVQVLAATGARAEALNVYETTRVRLADELGVDPGPELSSAHLSVLRPAGLSPAAPAARPAQLPADLPTFAGRVRELAALLPMSHNLSEDAVALTIVIGGMAGIGKTTLAVHWAHRIAGRFPDGQLYVNLRGFDPSGPATTPADALCDFLSALDVAPLQIPAGLDAQAALYRSILAGRRVLVLLDNARDLEQVRPLLPGLPGCLAIVTSRNELSGLVAAHGARPLTLGPLPAGEARDLLAHRLGAGRVAAEPHAVDDILSPCAGLPLAMAITAARAASHPAFPLAALAAELRDARDNLDAFAGPDAASDARAAFSLSYQALAPPTARLFRLLAVQPGPDIAASAAASLTGAAAASVRPMLAQLSRANLITEHVPGRYTMHDLLRAYATERLHAIESEPDRQAAGHRLLDHYLHTAHRAALLLAPAREPITPAPPRAGVIPEPLADHERALAWFTTERRVLLSAVTYAVRARLNTHAWQLAWAMDTFLLRQGHWHEWIDVRLAALAAALRLPDRGAQAKAYIGLGHALSRVGRLDEARTHLGRALDLSAELGDLSGQAHAHRGIGLIYQRQGHLDKTLQHCRQAGELYRRAGNRSGWAKALNESGFIHALLGDHRQALACCGQAITLFQELGDRHGEAATAHSLGFTLRRMGNHRQAVIRYRQALDLFEKVGDRHYTADTLVHLGETYLAAADPPAARRSWQRAVAILVELGHPDADQVRTKLDVL